MRIEHELLRSAAYMAATVASTFICAKLGLGSLNFFVYFLGALFATHRLFAITRDRTLPTRARLLAWVAITLIFGSLLVINLTTRHFISDASMA